MRWLLGTVIHRRLILGQYSQLFLQCAHPGLQVFDIGAEILRDLVQLFNKVLVM